MTTPQPLQSGDQEVVFPEYIPGLWSSGAAGISGPMSTSRSRKEADGVCGGSPICRVIWAIAAQNPINQRRGGGGDVENIAEKGATAGTWNHPLQMAHQVSLP